MSLFRDGDDRPAVSLTLYRRSDTVGDPVDVFGTKIRETNLGANEVQEGHRVNLLVVVVGKKNAGHMLPLFGCELMPTLLFGFGSDDSGRGLARFSTGDDLIDLS